MISITPQAAIHLVNVPFDGTQNHTLYFSTKAAQNTYFEGLQKQTFTIILISEKIVLLR